MLISQLYVLTGAASVCFSFFLLVASCLVVDAGGFFLFMLIWCPQRHLLLNFGQRTNVLRIPFSAIAMLSLN